MSAAAAVSASAISWRTGPHCMVMIASSPSRRYGVAVSPSHRRQRASRTAISNDRAGRWWHSSTITRPYPSNSAEASGRRATACSVAMSMIPDDFAVAATRPIWRRPRPRCSISRDFHCSTSGVRSTRISVGTR